MPKTKLFKKFAYLITAVALMVTAFNLSKISATANSVALTIVAFNKKYIIYNYEALYCIRLIYSTITFNANNENPFTIKKGYDGKMIDKKALLCDINYALNNGIKIINAKTSVIKQTVTEEYLKSLTNLRGRFTTYFADQKERVHNIKLASNYLSGSIVNENEEFSFNAAVGERSEERGFSKAKIILDGAFVDGIGGGVCQVSTTTYNALLLAGLKITEQHPHSLAVSYIEPSFDAMVSYGLSDLKFFNNTGGKVFIGVKTTKNAVCVSVYGKKMDKVYERVSVVTEETLPGEAEFIYTSELGVGQTKLLQSAKNGIKSEGYLVEYSLSGQIISNNLIRKDSYKSIKEKVLVGN